MAGPLSSVSSTCAVAASPEFLTCVLSSPTLSPSDSDAKDCRSISARVPSRPSTVSASGLSYLSLTFPSSLTPSFSFTERSETSRSRSSDIPPSRARTTPNTRTSTAPPRSRYTFSPLPSLTSLVGVVLAMVDLPYLLPQTTPLFVPPVYTPVPFLPRDLFVVAVCCCALLEHAYT